MFFQNFWNFWVFAMQTTRKLWKMCVYFKENPPKWVLGLSSTWENHADVDIKIFHDIYRHVIPIKWYSEIPEKKQNHVRLFKRCMTIVVFCQPSFILRWQCALYFLVCSISWLFLCAMNINESVISISSPESRHGITLLYNSATEQLMVFVQNFKSKYMSTWRPHVRIFYQYVDMKRRSQRQP